MLFLSGPIALSLCTIRGEPLDSIIALQIWLN